MFPIQQLLELYTSYLLANPFLREPAALYQPADYIMGLGGKRLRPLLLLMSYNLFKDEVENALPAAHAIEIFHNFTLLHDDIMDNAPLRRGKPTVHKQYNFNAGILSGDVMLIYAYEYLMRTECKADPAELILLFNRFAIEVCEGQQYDMNFESSFQIEISDYLKMIELKTAALIGGAMRLGAVLGGATKEDATYLEQFGRSIGIAFQLQDDILDTFGDPSKFGKKIGGDIAQNKKTFLLLKAFELADKENRQILLDMMAAGAEMEQQKIETVTRIYEQLNIRQTADRLVDRYLENALQCLNKVSVPAERSLLIRKLTNEMIGRQA